MSWFVDQEWSSLVGSIQSFASPESVAPQSLLIAPQQLCQTHTWYH